QAGDTTLRLARPVQGWQAGDRLVLPGTRGLAGETEILTLAAVSADGLTLTLATPLQYSHPGARGDRKNNPVLERLAARHPSDWLATPVVPGDTRTNVLDFLPHVGNLTRNVIFRSQNPSGTRGHIMVTHTGEGDFRWAEFRDLGRTTFREPADPTGMMGRQGRYAVHFHHVMDQMDCPEPCNRLEGSSLWSELPNHEIAWPVTVHDTRGVLIRENVAYNWMGAAFVTEDDGAQRNIIERNFSVRVGGSGGRTDWGNAANGFFFWGNDNIIRDNVAADIGWAAFEMYSASPFAEFARNEAYNTPDALRYWNIGGGDNPSPDLNAPQRVMKDFTAWSVGRDAVVNYPSIHLTFDGFVLRGLPGSAMGYNWGDYGTRNYLVQNNDVQGFNFGMHMPLKFNPTAVYEPGTFEIKDSYLRNRVNLWVINPAGPGAGGAVSVHPGTMIIRNVRYGDPYGNPSGNIYFDFWLPAQVHLLQRMQIFVYDYNGAVGQNFRAYWYEQASDFIVPYGDPNQGSNFVGAPEAGLTNAQAAARWEWRLSLEPLQFQYRLVGTQGPSSNQATPWQPVVIAGEMAPANATDGRPIGVHGLIAPL
ncbi:MAG TPA: right-handed parallel beta-helix repeat-containing protein, partial [Gemmataceae bacterium]|nr:right-handed parallel beta-helix repeat-containing protein [Gemmataceae bacterium]